MSSAFLAPTLSSVVVGAVKRKGMEGTLFLRLVLYI